MIKEAIYIEDYKILVKFHDGVERLLDLQTFLQNVALPNVRKYLDPELFKTFYITPWGLCWGDNEWDINPIDIYNQNI